MNAIDKNEVCYLTVQRLTMGPRGGIQRGSLGRTQPFKNRTNAYPVVREFLNERDPMYHLVTVDDDFIFDAADYGLEWYPEQDDEIMERMRKGYPIWTYAIKTLPREKPVNF